MFLSGYSVSTDALRINLYFNRYWIGDSPVIFFETTKGFSFADIYNFSNIRKSTLIFWMMTEGKMQSFLKKHFMRKRIWIHRCMYSRKIIILLLLMKSIQNFWQKYWLIQRCGRCSIRWRRR